MAGVSDAFNPVYAYTRPRNILGRADGWHSISYTLDKTKVPVDANGMCYVYPGTLVRYNATSKMVEPVTAATYSTYASAPLLTFYDATISNVQVEVVFGGEVVEKYCFGLFGTASGDVVEFGYVPASVKQSLQMILWK